MPEDVLNELAPRLRSLARQMAGWLSQPRRRPLSPADQASLASLGQDLERQATALDVEHPYLIVVLMGGTGVGKSSLLNALARDTVAQASFHRPTTRESVVYHHRRFDVARLDPILRACQLVAHDRPALEHKVLVDTPDVDSNEAVHRERLKQVLPLADVVLYVGSQEKYHDQLGWELFLEQRKRRAFAFVLNKWDRCQHVTSGLRPDEDLLNDLTEQGFQAPLLFRTCAQAWVQAKEGPPGDLPPGEQFRDLEKWLEEGLTRREVEAIKTRGVAQLLQQIEAELVAVRPPDLRPAATATLQAWQSTLQDEASATAEILLATLDPYQRGLESHFATRGSQRFRGAMAWFLQTINALWYWGATLQLRTPWRLGSGATASPGPAWDLASFSRQCTALATDLHLAARRQALVNRLLVQADQAGIPLAFLGTAVDGALGPNWQNTLANHLVETLHAIEAEWAQSAGPRGHLQNLLIWLGATLPPATVAITALALLYSYFFASPARAFGFMDLLLPFVAALLSMVVLYGIMVLFLPVRWHILRALLTRRLREKIQSGLGLALLPLPEQLQRDLLAEKASHDQLLQSVQSDLAWLRQLLDNTSAQELYGDDRG